MGMFPVGAQIIPNPYNNIAGFQCSTLEPSILGENPWARVYFVPGFPVMAWPMMEWVLETYCSQWFDLSAWIEKSVIVFGAMEAALTPMMLDLEKAFEGVKVFSLPSVDHPEYGRHIELGVKGRPELANPAYNSMLERLNEFGASIGPELVR
jgi:molybdopterin-biosynthesis enzyme MoeA-like protein